MDWGTIDTLPDIVGLAVRFDGHVGYTVGGGYAVEWRGFAYGCVKTKIKGRGWTHWYKLPFRIITTVKAGMTFDHVATARNGWNAIVINGQVGWVSGKYTKVI